VIQGLQPETDYAVALKAADKVPNWSDLSNIASTTTAEGDRIAFYSDRDGNPEIYLMNEDGESQRRLTFSIGDEYSPSLSPDGRRIAFLSDRADPQPGDCFPHCNYDLYVMEIDGANLRRLADTDAAEKHPDWSPDGSRILFQSSRDGDFEIYVMDADGGHQRNLTRHGANELWPCWVWLGE